MRIFRFVPRMKIAVYILNLGAVLLSAGFLAASSDEGGVVSMLSLNLIENQK